MKNLLVPAFLVTGVIVGALWVLSGSDIAPDSTRTALVRLFDREPVVDSDFEPVADPRTFNLTQGLPSAFHLDFENGPPEGMLLYDEKGPFIKGRGGLAEDLGVPPLPRVCSEAALGGQRGLRFDSPQGAAYWIVPATPDTPYEFSAAVRRARRPPLPKDPDQPDLSLVGRIVLFELHNIPSIEKGISLHEALQTAPVRHALDVDEDKASDEFDRGKLLIKSSVYTRAFLVALVAGNPGWWLTAGAPFTSATPPLTPVDFDEVALTRLPLKRYLSYQGLSAEDDLADPATVDSYIRKLKITADVRRGLLAPPSTVAKFTVALPKGPFTLSWSVGVLEELRPDWGLTPITFSTRLQTGFTVPDSGGSDNEDDSSELISECTLHPGVRVEDVGWRDLLYSGVGTGQVARITFETTSPVPCEEVAVIGEPIILPELRRSDPRPPNILLISLDTLRADHLGCYGYRRKDGLETSPHLDAFASRCVRFANARSSSSYTLPSHATMMTGLFPAAHGVMRYDQQLVSGSHEILAERFAAQGYATAGFTAGAFVSYVHGFHHGFDRYSILDPFITEENPFRDRFPREQDREFNDRMFRRYDRAAVERWMASYQKQNRPFFLFLHSYVIHNYRPPKELESRFLADNPDSLIGVDRDVYDIDVKAAMQGEGPPAEMVKVLVDLYDATIRAADQQLGALLEFMERQGLLENTVVLITSDHGEEFGEHHGLMHGRTVYEEVVKVPMLLYAPGLEADVAHGGVDLTDVAPTLLAAAGMPPPFYCNGMNLLARVEHDDYRGYHWSEVDAPNLTTRFALVEGDQKLIYNPGSAREARGFEKRRPPEFELFHLATDPEEQANLWQSQALVFESLRAKLRELRASLEDLRENVVPGGTRKRVELSEQQKAMLRELGYATDDREAP